MLEFSTFNNTFVPTLGDQTFIVKVSLVAKSMDSESVKRLPPQVWPAFLTIFPTFAELFPSESGFETVVKSPPSKFPQLVAVSKSIGNSGDSFLENE